MKNYIIEIKWSLIFVFIMFVWMFLEKLAGLHDINIDKHATFTNFVAIPSIAIYVFALLEKKKKFYEGSMSYFKGLMTGMIITLIIASLSPASVYLTLYYVTPDYLTNASNYAVESGMLKQSEAEGYFSLGNYLVQSFIGSMIMGLITSAVVAFFVKSKKITVN